MIRATDETVRGWIRDGRLKAETHLWRGRPYYLIAQAEVDRMLQADRPFDTAGLIGAGERGSASALALGALGGGSLAALGVSHTHLGRDVLIGVGALVAYCAVIALAWALFMLPHTRKHTRERRQAARSAHPAP